MDKTMTNPLKDILGIGSLLLGLPYLQWFLMGAPYASALVSYGGAAVVVWRAAVLLHRAYVRRQERKRREIEAHRARVQARLPPAADEPAPPDTQGTS